MVSDISRRGFIAGTAGWLAGGGAWAGDNRRADQAHIAITLDLEMSRNFPRWEDTEWDYQKGNLNEPTKQYALEAARRVKARGGVIHFFVVGQVFEQKNVDWLKEIAEAGHPIGNHTYDHIYVLARSPEELQFRFQRAPWLIHGRETREVIDDNIRMTSMALQARIGVKDAGFRTPGGFAMGLRDRPDVQELMLKRGFRWVSSKYPAHKNSVPGESPSEEVFADIVRAQKEAQPFVYPSGLIEVPMSPISDIGAFRSGRWKLADFLEAVGRGVEWAIANRGVYDFLCHPSCMYAMDPEFRTIELIADLVQKAGEKAAIVDLGTIASRTGGGG